jgi:hypothetical protein
MRYTQQSFAADSPYQRRFSVDAPTACEGARRALLGDGYVIEKADGESVKGRRAYRSDGDRSTYVEMTVVCVPEAQGGMLYANGLLSTYDVKKSTGAASVGLSAFGSVSLPIGQSADAMVKTGEETVGDREFYQRFFAAVEDVLAAAEPGPATPAGPARAATAPRQLVPPPGAPAPPARPEPPGAAARAAEPAGAPTPQRTAEPSTVAARPAQAAPATDASPALPDTPARATPVAPVDLAPTTAPDAPTGDAPAASTAMPREIPPAASAAAPGDTPAPPPVEAKVEPSTVPAPQVPDPAVPQPANP